MLVRPSVGTAQCLYGPVSIRPSVSPAQCQSGSVSVLPSVRFAMCQFGLVSIRLGQMFIRLGLVFIGLPSGHNQKRQTIHITKPRSTSHPPVTCFRHKHLLAIRIICRWIRLDCKCVREMLVKLSSIYQLIAYLSSSIVYDGIREWQ